MALFLLRLLAIWIVYEILRFLVVRRLKQRWNTQAAKFVREHAIRLESARFIDRVWIREALAQDPRILEAVSENAARTGMSPLVLKDRVDAYVDEIAPYFSMSLYYRFGARLARRFLDFVFEVDVPEGAFEAQAAKVPPGAVKVYVINHRANMDPLILAFALLHHVPMSYAVGEWALVWPLDRLFRAFGSYFVRRGEKDPLYHAVLERFVQLIAGHGAVTGFFIEGGLSRDGKLRRARVGLLDYLIRLRLDQPDREIVFLPVGLNYDRVFEDRYLTREKDGPLPKPTRTERLTNLLALLFWIPQLIAANAVKVAMRSHRKFGYASVRFGEPLVLSSWPGGTALHALPNAEREPALEALGAELLGRRIAAVVPATPVAVFCAALLREGPVDDASLRSRIRQVLGELRSVGAPIALRGPAFARIEAQRRVEDVAIRADFDRELLDADEAEHLRDLAGLLLKRRRVVARVITPTGEGYEVVAGSEDVVAYYANSIAHHLEPQG